MDVWRSSFQSRHCFFFPFFPAVGWGQSEQGGKLEKVLRQTELPGDFQLCPVFPLCTVHNEELFSVVVENADCKQVYGAMYNIPINKYHLCAGPINNQNSTGTCIVSAQFFFVA